MFSEIIAGQYSVKMDLRRLMSESELDGFEQGLNLIQDRDNCSKDICQYEKGVLAYRSETLLPAIGDPARIKVLLVFGNPATHSIKNGMFFFSREGLKRHSMWGKLAKAGLVKEFRSEHADLGKARLAEAEERRRMILSGTGSGEYLVGMTTFYSFPTPVIDDFKYSNVLGVERLFKPVLKWLVEQEVARIRAYPFYRNAIPVFVQKSSLEAFENETGTKAIHWPVRGAGASGGKLAELLKQPG
jgi:hypothetical protein